MSIAPRERWQGKPHARRVASAIGGEAGLNARQSVRRIHAGGVALAVGIGYLALLSGCAVGPNYKPPVVASPGKAGLGTFAPRLDNAGNSVKGQLVAGFLSQSLGMDLFISQPDTKDHDSNPRPDHC